MALIDVIININTNTIAIEGSDSLEAHGNSIRVGVESIVGGEDSYVEFNAFKCGFFIRSGTETIQYFTFPKAGQSVGSTASYLYEGNLALNPDNTYSIQVYVEDAGAFYDKTIELTLPAEPRPFDNNGEFTSWTYNSDTKLWECPVDQPSLPAGTTGCYKWNEQNQEWNLIEFEYIEEYLSEQ